MIRYRLMSPQTATSMPRAQVLVWIDAPYLDQEAPLHIDGAPALVASVRAALDRSQGRWRKPIGERAAPVDLEAAMGQPALLPFEPSLLEGREVLERRRPPRGTPDEIADRFVRQVVRRLLILPVSPVTLDSYDGEVTVRVFEERLFEWSHWRPHFAGSEAVVQAIARRMPSETDEDLTALISTIAETDAQRREAGQPLPARLLHAPVTEAQWRAIARELVGAFESAAPDEGLALVHDLQARIAKLISRPPFTHP